MIISYFMFVGGFSGIPASTFNHHKPWLPTVQQVYHLQQINDVVVVAAAAAAALLLPIFQFVDGDIYHFDSDFSTNIW